MSNVIDECRHEFRRYKLMADKGMVELDDGAFFRRPGEKVNPVALIVKHLAGNLRSRWTDLLTSDGEKPDRNRDGEFVIVPDDTRVNLLAAWERGWSALFGTLDSLTAADLERTITIRGEPHTVQQALLRGMSHVAYHTGQIMYLVRFWQPEAAWQTIAPGKSGEHRPGYLKSPSGPNA